MKRQGWKCPHCGNKDSMMIESNMPPLWKKNPCFDRGEETLLCVKPCAPEESTFSDDASYAETAVDGKVACGMQWDPDEEER